MTEAEEAEFEAWFVKFNSWDLTGEEFLSACFRNKKPNEEGRPGDTVYVKPSNGSELTRAMASSWWQSYGKFKTGWSACLAQMKAKGN